MLSTYIHKISTGLDFIGLWLYQLLFPLVLRMEENLVRGLRLLILKTQGLMGRSEFISREERQRKEDVGRNSVIKRLCADGRGLVDDRGMSTIEYALGCVAAAALGALLYTVVTSDTVKTALSEIFEKALQQGG